MMSEDQAHHAFLWDGNGLRDLGTLGGNLSEARWLDDAGEVVGRADISGSTDHHAVLWRNGTITDLGVLAGQPCSTAYGINRWGQIVGVSAQCGQPGPVFLWQRGRAPARRERSWPALHGRAGARLSGP